MQVPESRGLKTWSSFVPAPKRKTIHIPLPLHLIQVSTNGVSLPHCGQILPVQSTSSHKLPFETRSGLCCCTKTALSWHPKLTVTPGFSSTTADRLNQKQTWDTALKRFPKSLPWYSHSLAGEAQDWNERIVTGRKEASPPVTSPQRFLFLWTHTCRLLVGVWFNQSTTMYRYMSHVQILICHTDSFHFYSSTHHVLPALPISVSLLQIIHSLWRHPSLKAKFLSLLDFFSGFTSVLSFNF